MKCRTRTLVSAEQGTMTDATVEFGVLCAMFEAIGRSKKSALKRKHIRTFLHHVYTGHEHFSAMRLILPDLDKERANYGLKEAALAKLLADALGLSKDSEDAKKLVNWRKGGQKAGSNAGNFSVVASEVRFLNDAVIPYNCIMFHGCHSDRLWKPLPIV